MATEKLAAHERWSSRTGFLLAAIGGATGLGNARRFPDVVGKYGGGSFTVVAGWMVSGASARTELGTKGGPAFAP